MRKERPILYSTMMIQAKLEGRKTQTRRTVKLKHLANSEIASIHPDGSGEGWIAWSPLPVSTEETKKIYPDNDGFKCPYGKPGDILWARESWGYEFGGGILYKADHAHMKEVGGLTDHRWRPSIHMPKDAARIYDEIVSIRVERLQDISEADAIAEGIESRKNIESGKIEYRNYHWGNAWGGPLFSYKSLWEKINGPGSWDMNPWVWVVTTKILSTTGRPAELNSIALTAI